VERGSLLRTLEVRAREYGPGRAEVKLALLRALARRRLDTPREVLRLHEVLCSLRAYPDDREVRLLVDRLLDGFDRRGDLRRHRAALADTGIAGTRIHYRFYWPMARWLASRWPDRLRLDREDPASGERLRRALPLLVTRVEADALAGLEGSVDRAIDAFRGRDETDAAFLVKRVAALPGDDFTREAFHDTLDAAYLLEPGPDTPSRTRALHRSSAISFRRAPPSRERPDLRREILRPPRAIHETSVREGRRLVDLACEAMVTRSRDLEAFGYGEPRDVRIVDDGDGLEFVWIGVRPERRQVLHAVYGGLTLRNGVPIGYVQADALHRSVALSYNTFETFRGGEAAFVLGRLLAALRCLFDAESFSIEPYQLGRNNDEGLESGAWWFYYKLGFRPRDARVRRVLRGELARMRRDPGHRSDRATLEKLAAAHLYLGRSDAPPPPWRIGLALARRPVSRGASPRDGSPTAARLLGVKSLDRWSSGERLAWARWVPIVLALGGLARWPASERAALVDVIRAKGGRRESDFVARFDAHRELGAAVLRLLRSPGP
jgi:hypothetical protein